MLYYFINQSDIHVVKLELYQVVLFQNHLLANARCGASWQLHAHGCVVTLLWVHTHAALRGLWTGYMYVDPSSCNTISPLYSESAVSPSVFIAFIAAGNCFTKEIILTFSLTFFPENVMGIA